MSDYQGLVTKWREQVKILRQNAVQTSVIYAQNIFNEQANRIEKCADELAELIARDVQPAPDEDELARLNRLLQDRDKCAYSGPMRDCPTHGESSQLQALRNALAVYGNHLLRCSVRNSWNHGGTSSPCDCGFDALADGPVQQPATEPDKFVMWVREDISEVDWLRQKLNEEVKYGIAADKKIEKLKAALALRDVPQGQTPEVTKLAKRVLHYLGAGLIDPKLADELRELARNVLPRPLESGPCANEKQTTNKGEIMTPEISRLRAINLLAELSVPSDEPKIAIIESFMNDWREWDGRQVPVSSEKEK